MLSPSNDVQLGDRAKAEFTGFENLALYIGIVCMFSVVDQLDPRSSSPCPFIRQIATSIESALVPDIRPTTNRDGLTLRSRRSENALVIRCLSLLACRGHGARLHDVDKKIIAPVRYLDRLNLRHDVKWRHW